MIYYDRDYIPTPEPFVMPDELVFIGNNDINANKSRSTSDDIGTIDISALIPFLEGITDVRERRQKIYDTLMYYHLRGKLILKIPQYNPEKQLGFFNGLTFESSSVYGPVQDDTSKVIFGTNKYWYSSTTNVYNIYILMDMYNFDNMIRQNKADKFNYWICGGNSIKSAPQQ